MTGLLRVLPFLFVVVYSKVHRFYNTSVHHWSFEEVKNGTSSDLSGTNDAKISGDFRFRRGAFGSAIELKNFNSYINFGTFNGFCLSSQDHLSEGFSVLLWLKMERFFPNRVILQLSSNRHSKGFTIWTCNKLKVHRLCLRFNTRSRRYATDIRLRQNEWTHLGIIWVNSKKSVFVYINCVLVAFVNDSRVNEVDTNSSTPENSNLSLIFGAIRNKKKNPQAIIDELALWNTTLSSDEVCNVFSVQSGKRDLKGKIRLLALCFHSSYSVKKFSRATFDIS